MQKLTLKTVGSSPLVAEELRQILQSILALSWPIETTTTDKVTAAEPHTFYVCAVTQGRVLTRVLPPEQLFVFNLEPTTTFFMNLANIPKGENVYVFNNLRKYAEILICRCQSLGLTQYHFVPIAYAEQPPAEVQEALRQAHYIVGVDVFTGPDVLQSPAYQPYLRPDVTIIGGKRTASVASANQLLAALGRYFYRGFRVEAEHLQAAWETEAATALYQQMTALADALRRSALRTVTAQVMGETTATPQPVASAAVLEVTTPQLQEQLLHFSQLLAKIDRLAQ